MGGTGANQSGAREVAPDAAGRGGVNALRPEARGGPDNLGRYDTVLDDRLPVIHVVDEQIERADALVQAAFDDGPFSGRDDARHEIEGKDPLGAGAVAVDVE